MWRLPYDLVPLEFLTLRFACTEPPAICQLHFRFSQLGISSPGNFHLCVSAPGNLWVPMLTCLSLQYWGQQFVLHPHFFYGSKMSCWLFSLFSILSVQTEVQLPSHLHVELETGTLYYLFVITGSVKFFISQETHDLECRVNLYLGTSGQHITLQKSTATSFSYGICYHIFTNFFLNIFIIYTNKKKYIVFGKNVCLIIY